MSSAKKYLENELGSLTFGMLLRAYRTSEGITQLDLADKLGVTKSHISDLENGRKLVSVDRAAQIAKKLKESEKQFVRVALQDQVRKAGLDYEVDVA